MGEGGGGGGGERWSGKGYQCSVSLEVNRQISHIPLYILCNIPIFNSLNIHKITKPNSKYPISVVVKRQVSHIL